MRVLDIIKKAFTGGEWFVAYRAIGETEWKLAKAPENQWCADPFAFSDGTDHYIFVEQYLKEKEKGCIGYYKFIDGEPINQGIIIENTYHMSYPCVFEYNNEYYMIPESSANCTVDLYVADHFPDKWRKEKTLLNGLKCVDSTVYNVGNTYYLISYSMLNGYEIHVYLLNMEKKELSLLSKKRYKNNIARPGGRLFLENDITIRPAQDCSQKYGESLIMYEVDNLNNKGEYEEHEIKRINAKTIQIDINPDRVHHITKDGLFEVVDVFKERIDLLHIPKIILRSHKS